MNTDSACLRQKAKARLRPYALGGLTSPLFFDSPFPLKLNLLTFLFVLVAVMAQCALGQTTVGIQPLGSYVDGGTDQINLANLGVHVDIPLFQHKGRGSGMGINVHLVYDSNYTLGTGPVIDMGWRVVPATAAPGTVVVRQNSKEFIPLPCPQSGVGCNAGYNVYSYTFAFTDQTGYGHLFSLGSTSVGCQGKSPVGCTNVNLDSGGYAPDNSGYLLSVNAANPSPVPGLVTVTTPSGLVYSAFPQDGLSDTNGNVGVTNADQGGYWVNWNTTLTDNSNVSATITGGAYSSQDSTKWTSRAPLHVQYRDTFGNLQTVTVNYSLHSVNENCVATGGNDFSAIVGLADSVVYPDGSNYQFTYQANGQLASMRLPAGGVISYNTGSLCNLPGTGTIGLPATLSRSTSDGTTSYNQTATCPSSGCIYANASMTAVSHPDGSSEKANFTYIQNWAANAFGTPNPNYETAHAWYSASGALLKSTMRCYNGTTGDCTATPITLPITQIATTTTVDGLASKTVQFLNDAGLTTEYDEYDFGASSPTRKTVTTYASLGNNIADRPSSVSVYNGSGNLIKQTTYGYDENGLSATNGLPGHVAVAGARGNQTSVHQWLNTSNTTLDSHASYDDAGQLDFSQDARKNTTQFVYDAATDTCLNTTKLPLLAGASAMSSSSTCDPNTGLTTSTTDFNGKVTSYSYDGMLRPTVTNYPDGGSTTISYSGAAVPEVITTSTAASPNPPQVSSTTLDGYGRVSQKVQSNGSKIDTTYDVNGRPHMVSNSYLATNDATYEITSLTYDALGRKTLQTQPDGSTQRWSYSGNQTIFTDEVGRIWSQNYDALGRLGNVTEPNGASTGYVYDALGNLTVANQSGVAGDAGRSRNFSYDSLSRLQSATNPETGTIRYGYDANGNVTSKTDARGITVNYGYDALNRLTGKSASDGSFSYGYAYDESGHTNGIGRLTSSSNNINAATILNYDAMGRVTQQSYCIPTDCSYGVHVGAGYDLAGNLSDLIYPDGRKVHQTYDAAGRTSGVSYSAWNGVAKNQTYLTVADPLGGYDAAGHVVSATFGNNVGFNASYDNRERVNTLSYGPSSTPFWSKQYGWTANGNLQSQTDLVAGVQRQFAYDNLNRLTAAQDIFWNVAGMGSSGGTGSSSSSGTGAGSTPGAGGATPQWTDPDDSNVLVNPDSPGAGGWVVSNTSITPGVMAPDGTATASNMAAASGSSDSYIADAVGNPELYSNTAMTASVWMRAPNGSQTVNIYLIQAGVRAWKPVTVTTSWQQFQVSGQTPQDGQNIYLQIGGGGTITSGQTISIWNPKMEDSGSAGSTVTNFLPYSQRLLTSSWGMNALASDNAATAPDGSNTAATVTGSNSDSYFTDTVANPAPFSGQPVVASVWLRSPSGPQSLLMTLLSDNNVAVGTTTMSLDTAWRRFQVSTQNASTHNELKLQIGGGGTLTAGHSIQVWGAQMELASSAGPYVATAANAVSAGTNLTNLMPYSQQMRAPTWFNWGLSANGSPDTAPDGSHTAYRLTGTPGAPDQYSTNFVQNAYQYDGLNATASVFLKSASPSATTSVPVFVYGETPAGRQFTVSTTVTVTPIWKRFILPTFAVPSASGRLAFQIGSGTAIGSQAVDVWGMQVEASSHAGPYVATSSLPIIVGQELTNFLPNSQVLNGPTWGVQTGSIAVNTATAPDGTATAATYTSVSADSWAINFVPNPSLYDSLTVTGSVYLRVASGTHAVNLYIVNTTSDGLSYIGPTVANLTTTWQRFTVTGANQNGLTSLQFQIGGAGSMPTGQSIQVWGPQLVVGTDPAPYTPTNSSTTQYATGTPGTLVTNGLNEVYAYDSFGNILQNNSFHAGYDANNRMLGYSYDAAGNLLSNGVSNVMTWDAENRIRTVGGATYIYDAEGNRVEKQGVGVTDTIYFGGRPIARLTAGQWTDLVYGPSGLLAEVPGAEDGAPVYRMTDHLGTQVGSLLADGTFINPMDYKPFGQVFAGNTSDPYLFTGKERDTESGLDYFGARYYGSNMGRFMSPDWSVNPISIPFARLDNPQTLNLYSYVGNNPLRYRDAFGHSADCNHDGDKSVVCLATTLWDKIKNLFNGGGNSGGNSSGANTASTNTGTGSSPLFRVTSTILPPSPLTNSPSFYSASAQLGFASGSVSYVPQTKNFIFGPAGAAPPSPGLMLTAGYSRRPEDFLRGSSVQGCAAYGLAGCYGVSTSLQGRTLQLGEPALQLGIGTPTIGGSFGYGLDWNGYTQGLYESIPENPMATIPGPSGLNIEDPRMGLDPNP